MPFLRICVYIYKLYINPMAINFISLILVSFTGQKTSNPNNIPQLESQEPNMPMGHHHRDHFPQPTRPKSISDCDLNPLFSQEFHHPDLLELPKPSRPVDISGSEDQYEIHYPDLEYSVQFSDSNHGDDRTSPDPSAAADEDRIRLSPATGKTPKGEKEAVDELLSILVECMEELNTRSRESLLRKFFSEIEREERLEKFIVQRLKQSRVKALTELCERLPAAAEATVGGSDTDKEPAEGEFVLTRSISESVEELSQKLERFKVRTLDLGTEGVNAIVVDEQKK